MAYRRGNFVLAIVTQDTILAVELRESKEVANQTNIVALHDDAGGDEQTPANGLWVKLDALKKGHIPLVFRGRPGAVEDLSLPVTTALGDFMGGRFDGLVLPVELHAREQRFRCNKRGSMFDIILICALAADCSGLSPQMQGRSQQLNTT